MIHSLQIIRGPFDVGGNVFFVEFYIDGNLFGSHSLQRYLYISVNR